MSHGVRLSKPVRIIYGLLFLLFFSTLRSLPRLPSFATILGVLKRRRIVCLAPYERGRKIFLRDFFRHFPVPDVLAKAFNYAWDFQSIFSMIRVTLVEFLEFLATRRILYFVYAYTMFASKMFLPFWDSLNDSLGMALLFVVLHEAKLIDLHSSSLRGSLFHRVRN